MTRSPHGPQPVRLEPSCPDEELLSRFSRVMADRIRAMSLQLLDVYGDHPIESE